MTQTSSDDTVQDDVFLSHKNYRNFPIKMILIHPFKNSFQNLLSEKLKYFVEITYY